MKRREGSTRALILLNKSLEAAFRKHHNVAGGVSFKLKDNKIGIYSMHRDTITLVNP